MQIDFHHGVTYVVARHSGFSHEDAETIAYSAQYVDDATNSGLVVLTTSHPQSPALYQRLSSAHKMIDIRNFQKIKNHLSWLPFHFLPGNGGMAAGQNPQGSFIEKIICKPNSPIAKDMVKACIEDRHKPYALHRLGITAHVYVDTWAHQQFAGVNHEVNTVENLDGPAPKPKKSLWEATKDLFFHLLLLAVHGALPPIGHGQALTNPDLPFAKWSYTDGLGRQVVRDNLTDFTEAADELCRVFRCFQRGQYDPSTPGLAPNEKKQIHDMLETIQSHDAEERHREWLDALRGDAFGFGKVDLEYIGKGYGSWKHAALGTTSATDSGKEEYPYHPSFLTSDWKKFHDAAKEHRLTVIDDILPKYGICAG